MTTARVSTSNLCWWMARFTLCLALSFSLWLTVFSDWSLINNRVLTAIGIAAVMFVLVVADSYKRKRSILMFRLVERDQPISLSLAQGIIVVAWFVLYYAGLWWFVIQPAVER